MATIRVLPETVQNKIAAGEVIERPASVVKELAENAMDAGATLVDVEIEEGGHRLIRVSDNGCGMGETDLAASMQRHATSKISDVDDIFRISTFGFRGEALPSIASVSRLAIFTGVGGADAGHELLVEGGRMLRLSPGPPRRGTRVEVRDIFFNTPARRKFLRQPASETTQTAEVLTRLALGNPQVAFRFQANGSLRLAVKAGPDQLTRIGEIFGPELAGKMTPFAGEIADGLSARGYFARPPVSHRNASRMYVLVNNRWIRFHGLAKAVADEFAGTLPPREYPFAVINLAVNPGRVDVNVHPAKAEVRFDHERIVVGGVRRAVREALARLAAMPAAGAFLPPGTDPRARPLGEGRGGGEAPQPRRWSAVDGQKSLNLPPRSDPASGYGLSGLNLSETRERLRMEKETPPGGREAFPARRIDAGRSDVDAPEPEPAAPAVDRAAGYRILGQGGGGFIIVDCPEGLVAVDPHALHERWNYDRLVEARHKGGVSNRLLVPLELTLSPVEAAAAEEAAPELAEFGFEIAFPGANRLAVTAAPPFIKPAILEKLVRQVLADIDDAGATLRAARDKILAALACRASVLLGKSLPTEEMAAIIDWFFQKGQLPTCPHGRPTAVSITRDELRRRMGR